MKLTADDKKAKEENGIMFENCKDIESVSTELKRLVPKEEKEEEEAGNKGMMKMEANGMSRKCAGDGVTVNGKKVKEEENKNDFNLDMKEQEKVSKSITEDLEKFHIDNAATGNKKTLSKLAIETEKLKRGKEKTEKLKDGESIKVENVANSDNSVDEIMAEFHKLGLQPRINLKLVRDLCDERNEPNEESNLRTVEITAQPEKECEENEDFENTRVLSDANEYKSDESSCSSFVPRGPFGGVAKDTEPHDLKEMFLRKENEFPQPPRKFVRPSDGYSPMMSGGYVQEVVRPEMPLCPTYEIRHLGDPNISSQYSEQRPENYLLWNANSEQNIHPYYNDDRKNYANSCQVMQHCWPFYEGSSGLRGAVNPPMEAFPGGFEHASNPAWFDPEMVYNYHVDVDQGINCMPPLDYYHFRGQMGSQNIPLFSSHSPHDHCLTSPGSSPPSVLSYPLSPTSTILTNGELDPADLSAFSPGQISLSSPESGFGTDMSEDASQTLEDAMEFIKADMAASCGRANRNCESLLPLAVERFESDPTIEAASGSAGLLCQNAGNMSHFPAKQKKQSKPRNKDTRRAPKAVTQPASVLDMAQGILPPVNGSALCTTFYSPQGLGANQLSVPLQVPCFVVEAPRNGQKHPTTPFVPIRPKKNVESSAPPATKLAQPTDILPSAASRFSPPSASQPSPQEPAVTSTSDQDQRVKAYRTVAGLLIDQLLGQDEDGDTILVLAIVKEKPYLVKALLERYVREGLIHKVINLANKQHQTPLCLAVFLNQTEIVMMLIERKADVNVQLQRKLNGGLRCYRLIHYAASRGKKWVPTLIQLLSADNIDLQAFNSEGCTAIHCAIEWHGKACQQGEGKIDSKDTIYHLAMRGADLNVQHGLCGKTPLHYAIEKKDCDLVGWFIGLAGYIQSSGPKQSNGGGPKDLVHSILNAKPSGGVTALHLALGLPKESPERIPILKLLLSNGAEVSDGKLRQELAKIPEVAGLLKKNGPR